MVHGLKGHPGGDSTVTNHADGAALFILFFGGNGNTDARRNGGGGVADAQHVILALTAPRERMQATFLTNGANFIATSGQNFVRIGLVAHVPDKLIERRVIDIVQCHGQFYRAKPGGEMAA